MSLQRQGTVAQLDALIREAQLKCTDSERRELEGVKEERERLEARKGELSPSAFESERMKVKGKFVHLRGIRKQASKLTGLSGFISGKSAGSAAEPEARAAARRGGSNRRRRRAREDRVARAVSVALHASLTLDVGVRGK